MTRIGRRPMRSLNTMSTIPSGAGRYTHLTGPKAIGPTQYPATKIAMMSEPTSLPNPRSFPIIVTISEGAELAQVLQIRDMR